MRSTEKVKKEVLILNTIQMLQRTTVQLLVESIWVQLDIHLHTVVQRSAI